jgi:hypothetical protein
VKQKNIFETVIGCPICDVLDFGLKLSLIPPMEIGFDFDDIGGYRNNRFPVMAKDDVDGVSGTNTMHAVDVYIPALGIPLVVERYANSGASQHDPGYPVFGEWMFNYQEYLRYE